MTKSILSNWGAMIVTGLVSFFLVPVIIHGLGDFRYGLWVLVGSFIDYGGLLDLGIRATLHRYVGRLRGAEDREGLQETVSTAFCIGWVTAAAAILLAAIVAVALPPLLNVPEASRAETRWLILLLGASLAVLFPTRILGACLCGMHRFDMYNLAAVFAVGIRATLIVIALHLEYGLSGVALATLISSVLWLTFNWILVRYSDPGLRLTFHAASRQRARELSGYSMFAFLGSAGDYLRLYTDSAVIGRTLGIALVTPFSVAARLMEYFRMTLVGVAGPLMPKMSEMEGRNDQHELRQLFLRSTRWTTLLSLFLGSLLVINGRAFLQLWLGTRFLASYPLLIILVTAYVVDLAQYPSTVALYAKGRHKALAVWTVAEGVANLALSVVLAYRYGLAGVALGTAIPMLATKVFVQPWYTLRVLELSLLDYGRAALLRPLMLFVCFLSLTWIMVSRGAILEGIPGLILAISWQSALFVLLAWRFGLSYSERQRLRWFGVVHAVRT